MLLKYFYDKALAHASYMVGCQKTSEAIVVDPGRDIEQYLEIAKKENLTIVGVAETHIHADYVSGARELADRVDAKLYVSDEGPTEWKYVYLEEYDHLLLKDGDSFSVGKVKLDVLHTPGHTPESISFVLTDQGGGADEPMGIFTGDFVFVGSIGRPDLLEQAAGIADTAKPGARDLFQSAQRFKQLPDYLQVWPAHGAGSACGKGLGAIPSSTVGYEKRFNPALQFTDEEEFVDYILADQPPAPKYFALMKRVNKEGPAVLGGPGVPEARSSDQLEHALAAGTVVDTSPSSDFAKAHVSGSINLPIQSLANWGGWVLDYSKPVFLIAAGEQLEEAVRILRKIGVEEISGAFSPRQLGEAGYMSQAYDSINVDTLHEMLQDSDVSLVDVRSDEEWNAGHIESASHHFLGRLPETMSKIDDSRAIAVHCQSGVRSAIATSLLQAEGKNVVNVTGGYGAWKKAGLATVGPTPNEPQTCDVQTGRC